MKVMQDLIELDRATQGLQYSVLIMKVVQDLIELDQGWQYSVLPWRLHRI
jgi:hypothetical protein